MSEQTEPITAVMDLVAAIVEALDVPLPSLAPADEHTHYRLLDNRTAGLRATLTGVLKHPGPLDDTADIIRRQMAELPVTYTPFTFDEQGGEE
ncbi:hypothetical protein ACFY7C_29880 [Streptomyces sp. NPDC012769]|uniref:hypothetical protein n=1 Tax=Streptomyces sp. NPDC012769 TaxID=3364848 RepID=UPI0036B6677E